MKLFALCVVVLLSGCQEQNYNGGTAAADVAAGDDVGVADSRPDTGPPPDTGGVPEDASDTEDATDASEVDGALDVVDDDAVSDTADEPPNGAPVIVVTEALEVDEFSRAEVDASQSFDPDGDELRYTWRLEEGPPTTWEADGPLLRVEAPMAPARVVFALEVDDGRDMVQTQVVLTSRVVPLRLDVEDRTVTAEELVELRATAGPLVTRWAWFQTSGEAVELVEADTDSPRFVAPDVSASIVLEVRVSNLRGEEAVAHVAVEVQRDWTRTVDPQLSGFDRGPAPAVAGDTRAVHGDILAGVDGALKLSRVVDGQFTALGEAEACRGVPALSEERAAIVCDGDETRQLILFDVSDPRRPMELARVEGEFQGAPAFHGNLLLVSGVREVSVFSADPETALIRVGTVGQAMDELLGVPGTPYVMGRQQRTAWVIDLSEPSEPVLGGSRRLLGLGAMGVWEGGVLLFQEDDTGSIVLVHMDISEEGLSARAVLGPVDHGHVYTIDGVRGDTLFLSSPSTNWVEIFRLRPMRRLRGIAPGWVRDPAVTPVDGGVIVADGFVRLDRETDFRPLLIGPNYVSDVWGGHLVVAPDPDGVFLIYALADVLNPRLVAELDPEIGRVRSLETIGDRAYAFGREGMAVIDIRDPLSPQVVSRGEGEWSGQSSTSDFDGRYLWRWEEFPRSLVVYDLIDPLRPVRIASHTGRGIGIKLGSSVVFTKEGDTAVFYDASNPEDLVETRRVQLPQDCRVVGWAPGTLVCETPDPERWLCLDAQTGVPVSSLERRGPGRTFSSANSDGALVLFGFFGTWDVATPWPGVCQWKAGRTDNRARANFVRPGAFLVGNYLSIAPEYSAAFVSRVYAATASGQHGHLRTGEQASWRVQDLREGVGVRCVSTGGDCRVDRRGDEAQVFWTAPEEAGEHEIAIVHGDGRVFQVVHRDHVFVGPRPQ